MGKVEQLRALREQLRADAARTASPAPRAAKTQAVTPARTTPQQAAPTDELCGHRSIGNKACTRPANHTEKNHRYAKAT